MLFADVGSRDELLISFFWEGGWGGGGGVVTARPLLLYKAH